MVETGDDGSSPTVNCARLRASHAQNFFILAHGGYPAGPFCDRFGKRGHPVRGDLGVVQYELSRNGSLRFEFFSMDFEGRRGLRPSGFSCVLLPEPKTRTLG